MNDIKQRYEEVQARMRTAAESAKRPFSAITLIAVTKRWPVELAMAARDAGLLNLGENRAGEMVEKRTALAAADDGIVWHFIGALQSRKTNLIADHADVFHALDRMKIARRLSKRLEENGRAAADHPLPVFLEVNISGEASKAGFVADKWQDDATQQEALRNVVKETAVLPGLQLQGLMTMAPFGAPEAEIRDIFRRTRQLSDWLQAEFPTLTLDQLSMGMTDDFEIAIEEGATHIRVGRALFGERPK